MDAVIVWVVVELAEIVRVDEALLLDEALKLELVEGDAPMVREGVDERGREGRRDPFGARFRRQFRDKALPSQLHVNEGGGGMRGHSPYCIRPILPYQHY